ncbi:MAG: YceI family protein [Psychroserpens sp.]|nr:YceI family protein [Psychroserpens sp.]
MKTNIFKSVLLVVLAVSMTSFTTVSEKKVNIENSKITWKGYKVTGSHEGTINLLDGKLMFEGDNLVGGSFVIDMTSINVTDLKAGEGKEKLEGHLRSGDFFGVESYGKAMFTINKVTGEKGNYRVYGDLTIKGQTLPKSIEMIVTGNSASASFKIDRTKYDIKYGSASFFDGLKDKAIYDEFDLNVMLEF